MIIWSSHTANLSGTTAAAIPTLSGTVEADELVAFEDPVAGVAGELQTRVVRVAAGTLDFYYRVRSLSGQALFGVEWRFRNTPTFPPLSTPITTDVDFRLDGLGEVGPASASRSDYLGHLQPMSLLTLYFWFHSGLQPGETSRFVYVSTNATDFSRYRGFALVGEEPTWGNPQWHATASVFAPGFAEPHDQPSRFDPPTGTVRAPGA